ncbi:MAG: DUF4430 domain-containing protein [Oscillospiraceae bacterium]
MLKNLKRCLALIIAIVMSLLGGCDVKENTGRMMEIPADGVIKQAVFEKLMTSNDLAVFSGTASDINYQWLFIGSDIKTPKDQNLALEFTNTKVNEVKEQLNTDMVFEFIYASTEEISGNPSLSITIPSKWDCNSAEVYLYDMEKSTANSIGSAAVNNAADTIVTFAPQQTKGIFFIAGIKSEQTTATTLPAKSTVIEAEVTDKAQNEAASQSNTTASQPDPYLSDSTSSKPAPQREIENDISESKSSYSGGVKNSNKNNNSSSNSSNSGNNTDDETDSKDEKLKATLLISCETILNNKDNFNKDKLAVLPDDGIILKEKTITFTNGESVFDVVKRETKAKKIHFEFSNTPGYNSAYIEGIGNIYEFDCGQLSGWSYRVNGEVPGYGCSNYLLEDGDNIEILYTCDLGNDIK